MSLGTRIADKAGVLGSIVSAMGCAVCFPALASLGAAIGLGFLSHFEGLFIRILLPAFAGIALLAQVVGGWQQRRWRRAALGATGPVLVLAAVFVMRASGHRTGWLLYPGLLLMVAVSIWDVLCRPRNACDATTRDTAGSGWHGYRFISRRATRCAPWSRR